MQSIPQRLYNEVMMLDNFTCVYCGRRTPDVEADHLIPSSYGGPDIIHNLVAACPQCNRRKGSRQLHETDMQLRFGRFLRPTRRGARKVVDVPYVSPVPLPKLSKEAHAARVLELANQVDESGCYIYSANAILKIVGGAAAPIKAVIANVRGKKEQPPVGAPLRRPINGW